MTDAELRGLPDATLRTGVRNRDGVIADLAAALRVLPRDGVLAEVLEQVRARAVAQREVLLGVLAKRGKQR